MIRINEPTALGRHLLVRSDLPDLALARQEVAVWAAASGYLLPQTPRSVAVFEGERVAREWLIVERARTSAAGAASEPAPRQTRSPNRWRRSSQL